MAVSHEVTSVTFLSLLYILDEVIQKKYPEGFHCGNINSICVNSISSIDIIVG